MFLSSSLIKAETFYENFSKNQKIKYDNFVTEKTIDLENFYTLNLIQSTTPSIKFYADLLLQAGLPIDLAIVPLLESGNNPRAQSSKDALGLWQFIPSTAEEWGLITSETPIDDRINVIKSTKTALRYFEYLYNELGDWNLALAAYNWGIGSVKRSINKGLLKDGVINLDMLPLETRKYIIRFHHFNRLIRVHADGPRLGKYPDIPFLLMIQRKDLQSYLDKNNINHINKLVLEYINGYDVWGLSKVNDNILVPTNTFLEFFSLRTLVQSKKRSRIKNCGVGGYYRAALGDSFNMISKRFNIGVDKLKEMNPQINTMRPLLIVQVCV